jgi:ABC-type antimicrobial peptide transport system permease subunit
MTLSAAFVVVRIASYQGGVVGITADLLEGFRVDDFPPIQETIQASIPILVFSDENREKAEST